MFPCCFYLLFSLTVNKNKENTSKSSIFFSLFYNFWGFGFLNNPCLLFRCQSSGKGRSEIGADVPRARGSRCPRIGSVMGFDI